VREAPQVTANMSMRSSRKRAAFLWLVPMNQTLAGGRPESYRLSVKVDAFGEPGATLPSCDCPPTTDH
jgi:hypothetical protein